MSRSGVIGQPSAPQVHPQRAHPQQVHLQRTRSRCTRSRCTRRSTRSSRAIRCGSRSGVEPPAAGGDPSEIPAFLRRRDENGFIR